MPARRILQLGDPILRAVSAPVSSAREAEAIFEDLRDTLDEFRRTHGFGRGISAVQIGEPKRLIYIELDGRTYRLRNPQWIWQSEEKFRLWDDCFSFPDLLVWLERTEKVRLRYDDEAGEEQTLEGSGAFSELLQHEMDHLEGILAIDRAIDRTSFCTREEWDRRQGEAALEGRGAHPNRLYVVATPIGNLEDVTYRAIRVLGEVDAIACEDTRQTRKLLSHYGIHKPTVSYHEHNEAERSGELVARLRAGESIALVSDAGIPLVSDPGYRLVKAAIEAGIPVEPVPGPSAALTALTASGLPTDAFHFGGFLPAKPGQRIKVLEGLADEPATLIFYEAPHRILETLAAVEQVMGARPVVVARELTKIHEEFLRGTAAEVRARLADRDSIKGEMTLLIGKATSPPADHTPIDEAVESLLRNGTPRMDAIKQVARQRGLSKRQVYERMAKNR